MLFYSLLKRSLVKTLEEKSPDFTFGSPVVTPRWKARDLQYERGGRWMLCSNILAGMNTADHPGRACPLWSRWRKSKLLHRTCTELRLAETAAPFRELPPLPYFCLHNESQPADNEAPSTQALHSEISSGFLKCRNLGNKHLTLVVF